MLGGMAMAPPEIFSIFRAAAQAALFKAATARYHSLERAIADGYVPTDDGAELPASGP